MACHFVHRPRCDARFWTGSRVEPLRSSGQRAGRFTKSQSRHVPTCPTAKPLHLARDRVYSRARRTAVTGNYTPFFLLHRLLMSGADCPICMNNFKFEDIRSLPCGESRNISLIENDVHIVPLSSAGHTYCLSCIDGLIGRPYAEDDLSRCPECRQRFQLDDIRRLFIHSRTTNNNLATQASSSGVYTSIEAQGFVKQATYIAKRLRKMKAESPVATIKRAVDVIEHVATIQCKEAQVCPRTPTSCPISYILPNLPVGNRLESRARILA
jgi:hypothetical protein